MSEYQYFEFQAIDRPLNKKEMAKLRTYSTRARITPTSFVNDYSWGDFREMQMYGWTSTSTPFSILPTGVHTS